MAKRAKLDEPPAGVGHNSEAERQQLIKDGHEAFSSVERQVEAWQAQIRAEKEKLKPVKAKLKAAGIKLTLFKTLRDLAEVEDDIERSQDLKAIRSLFEALEVGEQGVLFPHDPSNAAEQDKINAQTVPDGDLYAQGYAVGKAGGKATANPFGRHGMHASGECESWHAGWTKGHADFANADQMANRDPLTVAVVEATIGEPLEVYSDADDFPDEPEEDVAYVAEAHADDDSIAEDVSKAEAAFS